MRCFSMQYLMEFPFVLHHCKAVLVLTHWLCHGSVIRHSDTSTHTVNLLQLIIALVCIVFSKMVVLAAYDRFSTSWSTSVTWQQTINVHVVGFCDTFSKLCTFYLLIIRRCPVVFRVQQWKLNYHIQCCDLMFIRQNVALWQQAIHFQIAERFCFAQPDCTAVAYTLHITDNIWDVCVFFNNVIDYMTIYNSRVKCVYIFIACMTEYIGIYLYFLQYLYLCV